MATSKDDIYYKHIIYRSGKGGQGNNFVKDFSSEKIIHMIPPLSICFYCLWSVIHLLRNCCFVITPAPLAYMVLVPR